MASKEAGEISREASIILPVYNEEKSIGQTISGIKKAMQGSGWLYEIIAVDDGSTDSTGKVLKKIGGIKVISHPYNKGYGSSLKTAIRAAKNNTIVMVDADGTYPCDRIPELLEYADDYELVSGARTKKGRVYVPFFRKPAKFMLTKLANFLTNHKIPDINCGLRVIKKDNVTRFFNILPSRFSFTITHLLACLTNDYNVKFVPIEYKKRKGKSTIHPVKDFIRFVTIIIRVVTHFNPFKIFFLFSFLVFLAGFLLFLYDLLYLDRIAHNTAVALLVLTSVQIFFFGLLADLVTKLKQKE